MKSDKRVKLIRSMLTRKCPHCGNTFDIKNLNLMVTNPTNKAMSEQHWAEYIDSQHKQSIMALEDREVPQYLLDEFMFVCKNGCPAERFSRVL